jgi:hypothetical protein
MTTWRLVLAGRDYDLDDTNPPPDLYQWVRGERIGPKRPGVARCHDCGVYSEVWGVKQAVGFYRAHQGDGHRFSVEIKRASRRRR